MRCSSRHGNVVDSSQCGRTKQRQDVENRKGYRINRGTVDRPVIHQLIVIDVAVDNRTGFDLDTVSAQVDGGRDHHVMTDS